MAQDFSPPDLDTAIQYIVRYLRERWDQRDRDRFGGREYSLQLHLVARSFLADSGIQDHVLNGAITRPEFGLGMFFSGAWELCRRGVLRPGVVGFGNHTTAPWAGGSGFSVTPYGEDWIRAADEVDLAPLQPGRFALMLARAGARFGPGFVERAEQAVGGYHARAFLACCVMCGAATESAVLALAIAKKGSEEAVLEMYGGFGGRSRVERYLLENQVPLVREEFTRYTTLLKHWRDDSAPGRAVKISEPEAYSSLALLLRFALWAGDRWTDLTGTDDAVIGSSP